MCNACSGNLDESSVEAFGGKLLDVINNAGLAMMISVGHRTGLFDAMDQLPPSTSEQIAEKAKLNERYVRECLGGLVTGGIVAYEATEKTYSLPKEHAALLTRAAKDNFASTMQWVSVLGSVEDQIVDCFRNGGGVPYSAFSRFHEVMAEESYGTVVGGLYDNILPMQDDLRTRLETGIDVLDVGCGRGRAIMDLAKTFPNSRFTGYDFGEDAIAWASKESQRQELSNVRFAVRDAAQLDEPQSYDWITAFDSIHDQAKPDHVLRGIAAALRPDGLFLMQDILASSNVAENVGTPLGPFLYTVSCMHCMTVSLSQKGMGLGAVWGKQLACQMLAEAGFNQVEVKTLEHDIINYYYLASCN